MKIFSSFHILLLAIFISISHLCYTQTKYPDTKEIKYNDTIHGNIHYDPYRWLENKKDTSVENWFRRQNAFTESVLSQIPYHDTVIKDLKLVEKLVTNSVSKVKYNDNRFYYLKYNSETGVSSLFYKDDYSEKETLLYDPGSFQSELGQHFEIMDYVPSWDNNKIIITLTHDATEHRILITYDIVNKKLLKKPINKGGYALWLPDNQSFIYSRLSYYPWDKPGDQPTYYANSKFYLHKLNESNVEDRLIFDRNDYPELGLIPVDLPRFIIHDPSSPYMFFQQELAANKHSIWMLRLEDLNKNIIGFNKIADKEDGIISFQHHGNKIYFLSDKSSPAYSIHHSTIHNPYFSNANTLIVSKDEPIRDFGLAANKLMYVQTKGVVAKVFSVALNKNAIPELINLPFNCYIYSLERPLQVASNILLPLESWTSPTQLWLFEGEKNELIKANIEPEDAGSNFNDLVVEEVFVYSHDSIQVPLSIIYDKSIKKDHTNPAWLLAYGSYGEVLSPYFMPEELIKCRYGVVWAIAHVRGGGELGKEWHEAGMKKNKPNTWKDFIACGEYLIKEGYTSSQKLISEGGSAGGITVGRAITERPDLFAVAIPVVGDMDKLIEHNLGPFNAREFGSITDSANYQHLLEMSSYRKIIKGKNYPAQLIMIGWNDPRIPPWQGGKFAARMQASSISERPVLLHVGFTSGHMGGKLIDNLKAVADKISFALWQTQHPWFQVKNKKLTIR